MARLLSSTAHTRKRNLTRSTMFQWLTRASIMALALLCYTMISTITEESLYGHHSHPQRSSDLLLHSHWKGPPTARTTIKNSTKSTREVVAIHSTSKITTHDVIGFAVTITECGDEFPIEDAASVLQFSIQRASMHGTLGGRYDYELYAIYHPDAEACVRPLEKLGYTLLKRPTPVNVSDIKGDFLRERIESNGCCGLKEICKSVSFTLTKHKAIVMLDLDVLILKPLDILFDYILHGVIPHADCLESNASSSTVNPEDIQLLYTLDYNMVNPERLIKPIQGGFVILKPNQTIYDDLVNIVRKGNYNERGWGGKTGKFWGSMTWQGLLPYYFHILHPNHSVELNRCIFDTMAQGPRFDIRPWKNETEGMCFTETCEDCRIRPIEDIYSAHFTSCLKPWTCTRHNSKTLESGLCRKMHHAWFSMRSDMEKSWGRTGQGDSPEWTDKEHFFGYCSGRGAAKYHKVSQPYGLPAS